MLRDQLTEAEYRLKRTDLVTQNKIENEKEKLTDFFEQKIEDLKKEHRQEIIKLKESENKLRLSFQKELSDKDTKIAILNADLDKQNSLQKISEIKEDTLLQLQKLTDSNKIVIAAKDNELRNFMSKIEALKIRNRSLKDKLDTLMAKKN